ncbi:MAG: hypothetical protein ABIJ18_03285 [archaeon]
MLELSKEIGRKIEITITLAIFLIVVIKAFLDQFAPNNANIISLKFSMVVGVYIGIYFIYHLVKNKIPSINKSMIWANRLLTINFLVIMLLVFYIPSMDSIEKIPAIILFLLPYFFVVLLWSSILIPTIVFFIFASKLGREIKKKLKFRKIANSNSELEKD